MVLVSVFLDLPTSRAQIFSRARSVSGRFFVFSAAKQARERTTGTGNEKRLPGLAALAPVSPRKNKSWREGGKNMHLRNT